MKTVLKKVFTYALLIINLSLISLIIYLSFTKNFKFHGTGMILIFILVLLESLREE